MSFEAMAWAVKQQCGSASSKLVLLMLANHSNGHTGQCNPSHKRLAEQCEMSVACLKTHIKNLEDKGFLTIKHMSQDGVSLPNQYILGRINSNGVGQNLSGGGSNFDGGVGQNLATKQEVETGIETTGEPNGSLTSAKLPPCPHAQILELFGEHLPELPQPKSELWTGQRQRDLLARWKWLMTAKKKSGERYAETTEQGIAWFGRFFAYVAKSDFLSGRSGKWTACDLGWLLKQENFIKVTQGNYENKDELV